MSVLVNKPRVRAGTRNGNWLRSSVRYATLTGKEKKKRGMGGIVVTRGEDIVHAWSIHVHLQFIHIFFPSF